MEEGQEFFVCRNEGERRTWQKYENFQSPYDGLIYAFSDCTLPAGFVFDGNIVKIAISGQKAFVYRYISARDEKCRQFLLDGLPGIPHSTEAFAWVEKTEKLSSLQFIYLDLLDSKGKSAYKLLVENPDKTKITIISSAIDSTSAYFDPESREYRTTLTLVSRP